MFNVPFRACNIVLNIRVPAHPFPEFVPLAHPAGVHMAPSIVRYPDLSTPRTYLPQCNGNLCNGNFSRKSLESAFAAAKCQNGNSGVQWKLLRFSGKVSISPAKWLQAPRPFITWSPRCAMGTSAIHQGIMPHGCKVAKWKHRCAMGTFAIPRVSCHLNCKVGGFHCTGEGRYLGVPTDSAGVTSLRGGEGRPQ